MVHAKVRNRRPYFLFAFFLDFLATGLPLPAWALTAFFGLAFGLVFALGLDFETVLARGVTSVCRAYRPSMNVIHCAPSGDTSIRKE